MPFFLSPFSNKKTRTKMFLSVQKKNNWTVCKLHKAFVLTFQPFTIYYHFQLHSMQLSALIFYLITATVASTFLTRCNVSTRINTCSIVIALATDLPTSARPGSFLNAFTSPSGISCLHNCTSTANSLYNQMFN